MVQGRETGQLTTLHLFWQWENYQMDYSTAVLRIIEARCDWITATGKTGGTGQDLVDLAIGNVEAERMKGEIHEPWRFQGYYGFHAGEWAWGWGKDGAIVCASGSAAEVGARSLATVAQHWSRVDYCVTAVDPAETIRPTDDYWMELSKPGNDGKQRPYFQRIQSSDGGSTLAIGRRTSAAYIRVYNKHIESEATYAPGSWRWELELKRHRSEAEQKRIFGGERSPRNVLALLALECGRTGLTVPWIPEVTVYRDQAPPRITSGERTLRWLERCVRPSCERAAASLGRDRVREALNL